MTRLIEAPTLFDALAFLQKSVREREGRGEKNLIFCEDGLTLLAERAVLASSGGTFLTEVTTFARFLSGERKVLSKHGSVMAVSAILTALEGELGCFSPRAAEAVYETIAQLSASRVGAEELKASAAAAEGTLRVKLLDLARILERYEAFLEEHGYLDENGYLALLPERIAARGLGDTNVYFFAFPSLTRQAAEGVRAACAHAGSVTGVFLSGEAAFFTGEGARVFGEAAADEGGGSMRKLPCTLEGDALTLYGGLFSSEAYAASAPRPAQDVYAFTARDEAAEAETVAALIKKHVAEGARFRDIAVLVPSAARYACIAKAFSAFHIPYTADVKRPFSRHPFCKLVVAVLEAVAGGLLPDAVDAVLANVCFAGSDAYRNYLMRYGNWRRGAERPLRADAEGFDTAALAVWREKLLAALACFPRAGKGSAFVQGVRALASLVDAEGVSAALAEAFEGAEKNFLSLAPLEGLLAETQAVAGERRFSAREFAALFESGASALKCAMIPSVADAVFVGDATDSRISRADILFLTGLTDELPRAGTDTAVITDGEIARLAALKVEIEPAIAVVNARAREALALNACAFSRRLYLSRPVQAGGEETAASELFGYLERLVVPRALPALFPYDCCERGPALMKLLSVRQAFEEGRTDDASAYASLYAALKAVGEGETADQIVCGGEKPPVPAAGTLYFAGDVSPTLLESYFACPYAGFLKHVVKVKEREERPVLARDTGTFVHAVLERLAPAFNEIADEAECRAKADMVGRELLQTPRYAAFADTKAGVYATERLLAESASVCVRAWEQLKGSAFRVRREGGELRIGLADLRLKGTVDRVDEAGDYVRVIDYKTGAFDPSPAAYYTGRSLQLELYLLAAAEGKKPAGAFYFPAEESFAPPDAARYRMQGFFDDSEEVRVLMDGAREGESAFFENGSRRGMPPAVLADFLSYARMVSRTAEREMAAGNVAPSPYEGACTYCAFRGACAFTGEARKETGVTCEAIAAVARSEGGKV